MKVLLINNFHYIKGGSERVYFNTGKLLTDHGHEVIYFSRHWKQNFPCRQSQYFDKAYDYKNSGVISKLKELMNYFYNVHSKRNLEKLLLQEKPDIVHIHLFWGGISPSIFSVLKKYNIPIVHTVHDYRMVCPAYLFRDGKERVCEACKGKYYFKCVCHKCAKGRYLLSTIMAVEMYIRKLLFNPCKYIDGFIFVSDFSRRIHEKYMPSLKNIPHTVLYNFVDSRIIEQVEKISSIPYYLFYGRLSEEKGITTVINCLSIMPDIRLKIVGTGPLAQQLVKYCHLKKISNIDFLGYKSGNELYSLVANAKFIIVPSEWYENNPMTVIESYTLGIPVIGARIGGIPEILKDRKTGFIFEVGKIHSLKEKILEAESMESEQYLQMKKEAITFAKEHFEKEKYYQKLIKFYFNFLNH